MKKLRKKRSVLFSILGYQFGNDRTGHPTRAGCCSDTGQSRSGSDQDRPSRDQDRPSRDQDRPSRDQDRPSRDQDHLAKLGDPA